MSANDELKLSIKDKHVVTLKSEVINYDDFPILKECYRLELYFLNTCLDLLTNIYPSMHSYKEVEFTIDQAKEKVDSFIKKYNLNLSVEDLYISFKHIASCESRSMANALFNEKCDAENNRFIVFIKKGDPDETLLPKYKIEKEKKDGSKGYEYNIAPIIHELRLKGVFPIKLHGRTIDEIVSNKNFKYILAILLCNKISSFYVTQKERSKLQEEFNKELLDSNDKNLELFSKLLTELRDSKIKDTTFRKFVKHSIDDKKVDGIVSKFKKLSQNHVFKEEDSHEFFSFSPSILSIFFKHRKLWEDENIFEQKKYIEIIDKLFSWQKEGVNISQFNMFELILSNSNFLKYEINFSKIEKRYIITIPNMKLCEDYNDFKRNNNNFGWENGSVIINNDDIKLKLSHSPLFNCQSVVSKQDNGNYKCLYSQDSQNNIYYEGEIKELKMYISKRNNKIYLSTSLTDPKIYIKKYGKLEEYKKQDISDAINLNYHFMTSAPTSEKSSISKIKDGEYIFMSNDQGVNNPITAVVYKGSCKNGKLEKGEKIASEKIYENSNDTKNVRLIKDGIDYVLCASILLDNIRTYIYKKENEIEKERYIKGIEKKINIEKILGINIDELQKEIDKIVLANENHINKLKIIKKNCPIIHDISKKCSRYFEKSRSLYMSSSEYCKNQNHVSQKDLLKKELTDKYIIFKKKWVGFGMTSEENNDYFRKNNHAKSYYKYRDGLVRKITSGTASALYRIALKYNVNVIFMEDLDTKRSSYDSREDNKVKDLFNFSKLKKELKQQAIKFRIPIVAVNPSETSVINYENGLRGVEYYRHIVTLENGEIKYIDRDDNAAENILDRGLSNHANLRTFCAEQVEENIFRVVVDTKQKSGALYSRIKSTSALFEKQDGTLKVIKTDLNKKDKSIKKINEKNVYVTLHGNDWMLMHDVKNNLEEFSKSQKFIDWAEKMKSANL